MRTTAHPTPLSSPRPQARALRAVLFDLDGTLYDQPRLRRAMLRELGRAAVRAPWRTIGVVRALSRFRRTREELRELDPSIALDAHQYDVPARSLGIESARLRATVEEWMLRRPLPLLAAAARPGLRSTLEGLRGAGLRLGVFSDYPPAEKLRALGVDDLFDVALAATDPEINAFKPAPAGFLRLAAALDVAPAEAVYVGDRFDVDAEGARRAGMPCVILRAARSQTVDSASTGLLPGPSRVLVVRTFLEIPDALRLVIT